MLKHVLVAIDFSPAWPQVQAQLARLPAFGCERVTLAYVIGEGYTQAPELSHREHYEKRLAKIAEQVAAETGMGADSILRTGAVAGELLAAAEASGADTILVGSQGHSAIREFLLGSTVLNLARLADCPLLLAPVDGESTVPGDAICRALLATDGSPAASGAEQAFLKLLSCGDRGVVVSVGRWDEVAVKAEERAAIEAHIAALAERAGSDAFDVELIGRGKPSEVISRVTAEQQANLVIVGRRGRNPLTELLLGSTAEAVCRSSQQLVLLVPAAPRAD